MLFGVTVLLLFTSLHATQFRTLDDSRETFFIHWFTDPPTVNIQKVKNKKKIGCQQFYDFS